MDQQSTNSTSIDQSILETDGKQIRELNFWNKKFMMGLTCITGVLALGIFASYKMIYGEAKLKHNELARSIREDLPAHFIPSSLPEAKAEEIPQEELSTKDLFRIVTPASGTGMGEIYKARQAFYDAREDALQNGGELIVVNYRADGEVDYSSSSMDKFINMDQDFSKHGLQKAVTTKPVNLSRVLPVTQIIPVILTDTIKSELTGDVVRAQIPQDVYSFHGRNILVPAGSIAVGKYKPLQKVGDTRLHIDFYRIVTPKGINIKISGFASDEEGSQGLTGDLDNKNFEKFGTAGLAAALQAAAQLSVDVNNNNQKAAADAVSAPLNEAIAQILSESINIAPTVMIAKGTPFNLKFRTDLWFPKPINKQINTVALDLGE